MVNDLPQMNTDIHNLKLCYIWNCLIKKRFVKSCVEEYGMEKEMVLEMAGRAFEDAEELSKMLR